MIIIMISRNSSSNERNSEEEKNDANTHTHHSLRPIEAAAIWASVRAVAGRAG